MLLDSKSATNPPTVIHQLPCLPVHHSSASRTVLIAACPYGASEQRGQSVPRVVGGDHPLYWQTAVV